MKAEVTVNGQKVGMFYNINETETQAEMHQRILNILMYRYGLENFYIQWEN